MTQELESGSLGDRGKSVSEMMVVCHVDVFGVGKYLIRQTWSTRWPLDLGRVHVYFSASKAMAFNLFYT